MSSYFENMFYSIFIFPSYNFLRHCLLLSDCYSCKYRKACLSREFSENCSRAGEQGTERPALYEKKLIFYIYDKKTHIIVQPIANDAHLLCSEQDKGGVRGQ